MAWEDVSPYGQRLPVEGRELLVAWRRTGTNAGNRLVVSIAKPLLDRLGWKAGMRLRVQRNRPAGQVRLRHVPDTAPHAEKKEAFVLRQKDTGALLTVRLDGLDLAEMKRAEWVPYEAAGNALTFTLPDWAAPERVAAEAAAAAKSLPAGMTAEDLAEAVGFIVTGTKDAELAEYFGWDDGMIAYARRAARERAQAVRQAHRPIRRAA